MLDFLFPPPLFLFSRSNKTAGLCTLELARRENKGERSERKRERERETGENYTAVLCARLASDLEGGKRAG